MTTLRIFRALAILGAAVAFGLAMLGSWTRINGAGMTCPDWPLCRGAIVPVLHGGVVLEWFHRLGAGLETLVVAALIVTGLRLRGAIPPLGGLLVAVGAVFVLQVLLGGATIFLANSPISVMIHWGAAMLLLTVLFIIVIVARAYDPSRSAPEFSARGTGPLLLATCCAYVTMLAGAFISSSSLGLICPSVPGCNASFFGQSPQQALMMTHRTLAAVLFILGVVAAFLQRRGMRRSTAALHLALALVALQITLGVLNVVWLLPTPLREAHAANAVATFLCFVVATVFASLDGSRAEAGARARATTIPERA